MSNSDRFIINLYRTKYDQHYRKRDWDINNFKIISITTEINQNKYNWRNYLKQNDKEQSRRRPRTMDEFQNLTKLRDIECFKLYQATKILQCFDQIFLSWKEKLIAERVLLESGRRVELLMAAIRQDSETIKIQNIGNITISNFKLNLTNLKRCPDKTEFYILMLINDLDVRTTKISRAIYDTLIFTDQFKFKIQTNYQIHIEIYSIELWDLPKLCYFRFLDFNRKKSQINNKKNRILYENIYTHEVVANDLMKTSFKFLGEFVLNHNNLDNDKRCFQYKIKTNLNELFSFDCYFDDYSQMLVKSGFLTLGQLRDCIVWNRRWCELVGNHLRFFNSPCELTMLPCLSLDLNHCNDQKMRRATNEECPRTRTIIMNFLQDNEDLKIFLRADNNEDLFDWIEKINFCLQLCRN